jgi:phospholipid/cholesterol/gamma-HCH transport system substrate-binding protein
MEVNRTDYIKAGIFIFFVIILFFIGYNWISSQQRQKHLYTYYIKVPRATLVSVGTKVLVRGVPNGNVIDVKIYKDGVLLKIGLKDIRLKENAYAQVITPSALGTRMIDLEIGNGDFLAINDTIIGYDSPTFDQILTIVVKLSDKVDSILTNTNNVIKTTNYKIYEISDEIKKSLNEVQILTLSLRNILAHQNTNLDSISNNINFTLKSTQKTISYIDSLLSTLKMEIDSLKYRGTIGKLTKDDSLYIELKKTILMFQEILTDIKKNPSKYINVKVF